MGLAVVARYGSLQEARIVCGALQSSGMFAVVLDGERGTNLWTEQMLLGGFRVMVSEIDLEDAFTFLVETAPPPQPFDRRGHWSFLPLLAATLVLGTSIWPWVAVRTLPSGWKTALFAVYGATLLLVWWLIFQGGQGPGLLLFEVFGIRPR
jgi:hypothetical protein